MQFCIIGAIVDGGIYFKINTNQLKIYNRVAGGKEVSGVRALIAIGLIKKHGVALLEVARRVGVSTAAVSKIIKRARQ